MSKVFSACGGVAACCIAVVLPATAQTPEDNKAAPVTVTASRFPISIAAAPVNVTVIDEAAIRRSGASDLAQLLNAQPGVYVQDLFGIGAARTGIDLGGYGATGALNTLILVNGRRLNDVDLSGANLATLALASISRVEIIRGSSSVLYGDNAGAGVVNIITRSSLEPQPPRAALEVGSFGSGRLAVSGGTTTAGGTSLFAAADGFHSDGYRDHSAFDNHALSAEFARPQDTWTWGGRVNGSSEKLELPGPLNEPIYKDSPTSATNTTETLIEDQYSIEAFGMGDAAAGELTYRRKLQDGKVFGKTHADLSTWSLTPRLTREIAQHHLIAGIDLYHSVQETRADFGAPNINDSDTTRDSYAVYLTDRLPLGEATEIAAGARYQQVGLTVKNRNADSVQRDTRNDEVVVWDATLSHRLRDSLRAYLRYAESFRFPVLDEIWSYYSGTISLLEPQRGRHLEAGAEWQANAATSARLSASRADLDDEIGFDYLSFANINLDATRHDQVDADIRTQATAFWGLQLGYSYRHASFRKGPSKDQDVPEIPRHQLTFTNVFRVSAQDSVGVDVLYTGARYFGNDFGNEGKRMDGYTMVNANVRHDSGAWSARFKVNNLTDTNTAQRGYYNSFAVNPYYYYPLPERAYYLMIEWHST